MLRYFQTGELWDLTAPWGFVALGATQETKAALGEHSDAALGMLVTVVDRPLFCACMTFQKFETLVT